VFWSTAWIVIVYPGNTVNPIRDTGSEDSRAIWLDGAATHATSGRQATRMSRRRTLIIGRVRCALLAQKVTAATAASRRHRRARTVLKAD
jgi:hypothetical protein